MAIKFHEQTRTFHIYNKDVSYIMRVMENEQLENLYYGKAVHDKEDFNYLHQEEFRSMASNCTPEPGTLAMHHTKQEYPSYGKGDYRSPAFTVIQENGSRIVDFKYVSHEIFSGKKLLEPLPATYVDSDDEATSLEVTLHDDVMNTDMILSYTIYEELPVITRNVRFVHKGEEKIVLDRALSASVEFVDADYEMIHLAGAWSRERYVKTRKLEMGIQSIQSLAGTASSAEHNPFVALQRPNTTEHAGEVFGFSFVYSGNFLAQVEVTTHELTRVMMGINPENFAWELQKGEEFQTPEVVMVYSDAGLNKMSQAFHKLYRSRLTRGVWRDKTRPILLNNWEATYFDFNEEKILEIAKKAKEVGVELFVLDDGWFGARNDDWRGLGDWYCNMNKLENGISGLSEKVEALGLKFGLWFELEMVNKDSDLYRAHPDYVIGAPGRFESHARHQHVLDFSRKEVVDNIYEQVSKILRESKISYIKWDMNRYMSEPFTKGGSAADQGKMMHKYILGVYDLYNRLTTEFPEILFESCASGGARFDPAMLYYAPQAWTSDDTDANERLKIQYGTSFVYPLVSMGSHVSAVPNHQLNRITPIDTRADVAYFGTFGYELDLNRLPEAEVERVKQQIEFMKKYRQLIQVEGDFYRLKSPFEGNETSWMVVSPDKSEAIVGFYQSRNKVNAQWLRQRLTGLDPDKLYEVSVDLSSLAPLDPVITIIYGIKNDGDNFKTYKAYGSELMNMGLVIERLWLTIRGGDYSSLIFTLKEV